MRTRCMLGYIWGELELLLKESCSVVSWAESGSILRSKSKVLHYIIILQENSINIKISYGKVEDNNSSSGDGSAQREAEISA